MKLSKQNNLPDGIDDIEYRDKLYYNKFKYRASMSMTGLRRTIWCDSLDAYKHRFQQYINDLKQNNTSGWGSKHIDRVQKEYNNVDFAGIERFIEFRKALPTDRDTVIMRLESDKVAFFSNDLQWLRKLEKVAGKSGSVTYTEASAVLEEGVKYFQRVPKYKHRVYFKTTHLTSKEIKEISDFLKLYNKDSNDKHPPLKPSDSLKQFLLDGGKRFYTYQSGWLGGHHYIEYDDEQYVLLVAMKFTKFIGKMFKLEKRPDPE